jgi:hypothetical protein
MPLAYPADKALLAIKRPQCPKCQARMMSAREERQANGADLRTFACLKCELLIGMCIGC